MVHVQANLRRRRRSPNKVITIGKYTIFGGIVAVLCVQFLLISQGLNSQEIREKEANILLRFVGFIVSTFFSCVSVFCSWTLGLVNGSRVGTSGKPISIGVYYYPWWKEDRRFDKNYLRDFLQTPQQPLLGNYWSRNNTVVDKHLEWMNAYGISHVVTSWWGKDGIEDITTKEYMLKSPQLGDIQIALLYESFGRIGTDETGWYEVPFDEAGKAERTLLEDVDYIATTYFSHPNYLKIDGKPVIYFYTTRIYNGNYIRAFENVRKSIRDKYGYELYLVADEVYWNPFPNVKRIKLFDALTAYNMYFGSFLWHGGYPERTHYIDDAESVYTSYQEIAAFYGLDFIPNVIPGYNDRGVRLEVDQYPIPHEHSKDLAGSGKYTTFQEFLKMAYRITRKAPAKPNIPSIIMVTSWNEWHEDSSIEPTQENLPASNQPYSYTQGYTYVAHGFDLLKVVQQFLKTYNNGDQ